MDSLRSLLVDSMVFDFLREDAKSCRIIEGSRKAKQVCYHWQCHDGLAGIYGGRLSIVSL